MAGDGKAGTSKEMKKSWKSKTVLANAGVAVAAVMFPELLAAIPVEYQALSVAVLNVGLRFLTNKGVEVPFVK